MGSVFTPRAGGGRGWGDQTPPWVGEGPGQHSPGWRRTCRKGPGMQTASLVLRSPVLQPASHTQRTALDGVCSHREPHRLFQDVANLEAREADSGTGEVASDFLTLAGKNTQGVETKKLAELTAEN